MDLGDAFILRDRRIDDHLQIVISDPTIDAQNVVLVGLTSYDKFEHEIYKDGSCILGPEDHPWIRHQTCVSYVDGRVVAEETLDDLVRRGVLESQEPVNKRVLERILDGAEKTEELPNNCRLVLVQQRLISF